MAHPGGHAIQASLNELTAVFEAELRTHIGELFFEATGSSTHIGLVLVALSTATGRLLAKLPAELFPGDLMAPQTVGIAVRNTFCEAFDEVLRASPGAC